MHPTMPRNRVGAKGWQPNRPGRPQRGALVEATPEPSWSHAFRTGEAHDRFHVVVHGVNEACGALWLGLNADVKPYGRVEGHFLLDEEMRKLVPERVAGSIVGKIAAFAAPAHDSIYDARD